MADSDPKRMRPTGSVPDRRSFEAEEEDPLVELARIVSEDSAFYGSGGARPHSQRQDATDRNAYSADLEAELLQELESSFRQPQPQPRPVARPAAPPPRVEPRVDAQPRAAAYEPEPDESEDLLRSIEEQIGEFERTAQAGRPAAPPPLAPPAAHPAPPQQAQWGAAPEPFHDERYAGEAWPDEEPREPQGGPMNLRTTFGDFDEVKGGAPAAAGPAGQVQGDLTRELEPSYSDPSFGGHWQDEGFAPADSLPDEPRVAPAVTGAGFTSRRVTQRRGPNRAVLAAAAVIGVLVVGGAAAFFMRSGNSVPSGPPPVIAADESPVKVQPPQQGEQQAASETAGEAVYNRVAGSPPAAEEQVVENAEEPREVARIVLPPSTDENSQLERPVGDESAGADVPPGPRLVRTFTVRPDGTIVPSGSDASAPAAAATPAPAPPIAPVPVPTTAVNGEGEPQVAASTLPPAAAAAEAPVTASAAPATDAAVAPPTADNSAVVADDTPQLNDMAAAEAPPPNDIAAAAPAEAPAPPAEDTAAPADIAAPEVQVAAAPAPEAQAPAPTAAAGDGYMVQLSSQRSEEAARSSFGPLQRRFPSLLGGLEPDVQQANLGEKGIYYRLRVGPWATRAEAVDLCEKLKAAGGSCLVAR
jgi:hypothetical protein